LINLHTGKIIYTKHFLEDYPEIKKSEVKAMSIYFR